jgi:NADPH-dependent ferric siderophore reductase
MIMRPQENRTASAGAEQRHQVQRVRHDTRRRMLTVTGITSITPKMLRIEFTSHELADFVSSAPDDHVKVFLPASSAGGERCMRDYTPRSFNREKRALTIDFAVHVAGPATAWALQAKVGDELQIGGPRGSVVVPDDFDWYLLIADETGLPALGRRLEELRPDVPVTTVVVIDNMAEAQQIDTRTTWTPHWVCRDQQQGNDAERLRRGIEGFEPPPGAGYVWIAAEASAAKALRAFVVEERNHPPGWMRAAGYWRRGEPGAHENFA